MEFAVKGTRTPISHQEPKEASEAQEGLGNAPDGLQGGFTASIFSTEDENSLNTVFSHNVG